MRYCDSKAKARYACPDSLQYQNYKGGSGHEEEQRITARPHVSSCTNTSQGDEMSDFTRLETRMLLWYFNGTSERFFVLHHAVLGWLDSRGFTTLSKEFDEFVNDVYELIVDKLGLLLEDPNAIFAAGD